MADRRRERCEQPLGIGVDDIIEITRVGIELADLPADCLDHGRMRMPDRGNVVVDIEIAPAFGIMHPDAFGAHHADRLPVEQHRVRTERLHPSLHSRAQTRTCGCLRLRVEGIQRQNVLVARHTVSFRRFGGMVEATTTADNIQDVEPVGATHSAWQRPTVQSTRKLSPR